MEENHQGEDQENLLRLNDFQHYLDTRGLRDENHVGANSHLNISETQKRLADEKAYQESIHAKAFSNDDDESELSRKDFLNSLSEENKILLLSTEGPVESTLKNMASICETIYALAINRDKFKKPSSDDLSNKLEKQGPPPLELSLEEFSLNAVQEFVNVANGNTSLNDISSENIVECCQIAHYLQCDCILNPLVEILIDAVDSDNCRSLLELADRLGLPSLFERSLSHMMNSLSETENVWDDLSQELKDRISKMKEAIESSVLAGKSRLYFGSIQEYLAMFAETVQYHQERLYDAKERQAEERRAHFMRSNAWEYNQRFIDRQERRVEQLKMIMKKQKSMFSQNSNHQIKIKA